MHSPIVKHCGIIDVTFGKNVTVVEPVNLYGCEIGDDVFIGPFVEIQRQVIVGKRCRIQSHVFICEQVSMGSDCFISHGAMFINDRIADGTPARTDRTRWSPTRLGSRVVIGTNATVLPVAICDGAVIGAGAVVTGDISTPGVYAGNPARRLRTLPAAAGP